MANARPPTSPPPADPAEAPSLVIRTLLTMARQRDGLNEPRCRTILDFLETSGALGGQVRADLARDGLTRIRFAALLALFALDPVPASPSDLALHLGASRPAVSAAVANLARRRFIAPSPNSADRRGRCLTLTPSGRAVADRAATRCLALLGELAQAWSPSSQAQLRRSCAQLRARLRARRNRPLPS